MLYVTLTVAWLLGLIYATIPAYWLTVHPFAHKWAQRKGKTFPILGLIWLVLIILAAAATARWRFETFYQTWWSLLPGGVLAALDVILLNKIGKDFGRDRLIGKNEVRPDEHEQRLITTGMHARMRHPIYLAHLIMLSALTVASGLTVIYALLAFAVMTGAFMIRAEEAELEKRFGDEYRDYKERVPAIFPFSHARVEHKSEDRTLMSATASKLRLLVGICTSCNKPLDPPHQYVELASMVMDASHKFETQALLNAINEKQFRKLQEFRRFEGSKDALIVNAIRCPSGGMLISHIDPHELYAPEQLNTKEPLTIEELQELDEIANHPHWHSF
jgi:protein-S-isoprenylcysteine O-methyltransferase Ste14